MKTLSTLVPSLTLAAGLLCGPTAHAAELLLDGTFATTVTLPASNYNGTVGRSGNTNATYFLTGTTTAGLGWQTDGTNGLFELWTAGFQGTPAGIGNALELADTVPTGSNSYQLVNSTAGGGTQGTVSFGYAARESGNDRFTVSVTDLTAGGASVFSVQLNPTNALNAPVTFTQSFTLVPGDQYKLNFLDQNTSTSAFSAHINSVSFQQVPEPSTVATTLLGVGLSLFLFRRKRTTQPA